MVMDIDKLLDSPARLDKLDKKILYELMLDARRPLNVIAKAVNASPQRVLYKIKQLEKKGVITGFLAILQLDKLGMNVYRVLFRIERADTKKEEEIIQYFTNKKNVFWLVKVGNRWDLLVDFVAPDIHSFYDFIKESMAQFKENLRKYEVMSFVDSFHFRRSYLIEEKRNDQRISYFAGTKQKEKIDETDLKILKAISHNARKSNATIAQEIGLSPNTVMNRIKKLESKGVIQGYSAFIHPTVFGATCAKVLLYVRDISKEIEKKLIAVAVQEPNICFIEKMIAPWNYEYDVECNSEKEFRHLMRRIKDTFADELVDYEIIPFYYDYKIDYLAGV